MDRDTSSMVTFGVRTGDIDREVRLCGLLTPVRRSKRLSLPDRLYVPGASGLFLGTASKSNSSASTGLSDREGETQVEAILSVRDDRLPEDLAIDTSSFSASRDEDGAPS
mmetsp:Transcript_18364/g.42525  ORF Transcript_18364/g.42525 Transcript_18364/m.42525 type:complete len:110 (-) Transcript_18364:128-457(-)